jgi:uncharacterized caspase-like protein
VDDIYAPTYATSRGLIVGINEYEKVAPLSYAVDDATAVRKVLVEEFGFDPDNVRLLIDAAATRQNILGAFLSYASDDCAPDDRLLFFFAGHGHTRRGRTREVGFLVPVDGDLDDLSSLIRWDELTQNSELIPAKHVLFIMDACYGGLALTRTLLPGSVRFLRDMLTRYTRQVITAGKANETVADSGGPLPNHSIFTGHLLEALHGKAEAPEGILTANGLMSYVYERVAKDPNSRQTPHFGFLEGDGDFIFKSPLLDSVEAQIEKDEDVLVAIPVSESETTEEDIAALADQVKQVLPERRYTIALDSLLVQELRKFLALSADDFFAAKGGQWSPDKFRERIKRYEDITLRLEVAAICIAHWGTEEHWPILRKILARMTDRLEPESGLSIWIAFRWYPILLLIYSSGIAAIAGDNYENLAAILKTPLPSSRSRSELRPAASAPVVALSGHYDAFKALPGHDRNYVAQSEYFFKLLQPLLDDLLFLGRDYETYFDRFEVLNALACADHLKADSGRAWGPFGRFAWKYRRGFSEEDPFRQMIQEAESQREDWPPIKSGLFQGSCDRFLEIASEYEQGMQRLKWF